MRIPAVLFAYMLIGCLMASCGSGQAPKELTINVPHQLSGLMHVHLCDKSAPGNNITIDDKGEGSTSMCPDKNQMIQLRVMSKKGSEVIPANMVTISRSDDGFATLVISVPAD